ncbi:hypothetical protein K438DRAFT_1774645 [Mycena galopus ATCC 62051]|nr:hypothetical protein K438DRAFT_1774645 [Mycena galopus ATCC 62051]
MPASGGRGCTKRIVTLIVSTPRASNATLFSPSRFLPIPLRSHYRLVLEARSTLLATSPYRVSPHRTSPASRCVTALPLPHAASPRPTSSPYLGSPPTISAWRGGRRYRRGVFDAAPVARSRVRRGVWAYDRRHYEEQEETRKRRKSSWEQAWPTRVLPYARRGGACASARAVSRPNSVRRPPTRGGGDDEEREDIGMGEVDSASGVSVIAPLASRSRAARWAGAREARALDIYCHQRTTGRLGRGAAQRVDGGAAAGVIEMERGAGASHQTSHPLACCRFLDDALNTPPLNTSSFAPPIFHPPQYYPTLAPRKLDATAPCPPGDPCACGTAGRSRPDFLRNHRRSARARRRLHKRVCDVEAARRSFSMHGEVVYMSPQPEGGVGGGQMGTTPRKWNGEMDIEWALLYFCTPTTDFRR